MNQSINTDSKNSKEPQQKYRLGTVSIQILGGLNRFYGRPTSPSAEVDTVEAKNENWLCVMFTFLCTGMRHYNITQPHNME